MIPKAAVAGFMLGQQMGTLPGGSVFQPVGAPLNRDVINRIWADVVKTYPYQSLQLDPTGRGGRFIGSNPDDIVILQPHLLQIRVFFSDDTLSIAQVAEQIQSVFKSAVFHIGGSPPINLGVKLIYNAPAPGGNSVDFLRTEFVKGDEDLRALAGSMDLQASIKLVMTDINKTFTLLIEPLQINKADLYLDLDVQFAGIVDVGHIKENVMQTDEFIKGQVQSFLDRRSEEWTK